jgi:hypothetical protein
MEIIMFVVALPIEAKATDVTVDVQGNFTNKTKKKLHHGMK